MTASYAEPSVESLQAYLSVKWPERVGATVADLRNINAGWESDVYAFDLLYAGGREPLILRIYPGQDAWTKSEREYEALRRLYHVGYPVPAVSCLEREGSPFGRPFIIMERIEGHGMWYETFNGPEAQQRARMELFCGLFVRLHTLDWHPFVRDGSPAPGDPYASVDRYLHLMQTHCRKFEQAGYLRLFDWLAARRDAMACDRPVPIHWDYHPANIMLREDGSAVVIDWTQFEISDPRFDLAWTLMLVGSEEHNILRVRERILSTYERILGEPVREIELFEVVACVKRLASVTMSLTAGADKLGMRPGAEEIMLRQLPALALLYEWLQGLTGLRVPEVDRLLGRANV